MEKHIENMKKNKNIFDGNDLKNNYKNIKIVMSREKKRLIYYVIMITIPLVQLAIFYFYVNFNSILISFRVDVDILSAGFTFDNFKYAINKIIIGDFYLIKNSFKFYILIMPISLFLTLVFSFYIYKKMPGAKTFKVFLFLPQLISGMVFGLIFKYLCDQGYKEIVALFRWGDLSRWRELINTIPSLLENKETIFMSVFFYNFWFGFGPNMLLYSGAMSGIDESIVESAKLDGVNYYQEFFHITFPLIYPTFLSIFIVGLTGILSNQMGYLVLFGNGLPSELDHSFNVIGFKMYLASSRFSSVGAVPIDGYKIQYVAAYGVVISLIVIPIIMGLRRLLIKVGPNVD